MDKSNLPRPKWYSAEELAEYWGVKVSLIQRFNQTGQLISEVLFTDSERNKQCWMPQDYTEADWQLLRLEEMIHVGKYYKLEEVERFEKECVKKSMAKKMESDLLPAEKKSLLKMVYAMAVDCYRYDPEQKKSPIPSELATVAAQCDISITSETVLKWLKEGATLRDSII